MALIKIIPSPLSKRFNGYDGQMTLYVEGEVNGIKEMRSMGEYKRERMPMSVQGERIVYSSNKKRYLLEGYETNSDELNELVKRCNLFNDIKKHPEFGRPIVSCDIFNSEDPFFNNKKVFIRLEEGYGVLNTENPLEYILYKSCKVNSKFQIGGERINPALNGRAKYILVDSSIDRDAKKKARSERKNAEKLIENMSDDKKRTLALAMGLIKNEDTNIDIITEVLEEAALDDRVTSDYQMSRQKYLIKLAESPNEELESRKYVNRAFQKGLIKRDRETGSFVLFGAQIGKEKQNVITYLLNPLNSEVLYRLQKAIDLND